MLCQFSFKNFTSYRDETTFDFQASELTEYKETLIEDGQASPLLPISVVYGPNGGGKSNLLKALSCVLSLVVRPIAELEKTRVQYLFYHKVPVTPFAFDAESSGSPTEFKLYFRINGYEYRYYISLLRDEIISESLYRKALTGKRPALIFEREGNAVELGLSIRKKSINTEINPKMPYLSFLAINYNLPIIVEVQTWFESCIVRNYGNRNVESKIMLPFIDDPSSGFNRRYISALNEMGIDISGFRYDTEQQEIFLSRIIHDVNYELPFSAESDGTKKLLAVLPVIQIALSEGRLIVIDELDSKLHPKLLRHIISLFTDRKINRKGAQLLFTSQDVSTMKKELFRRDEIWFAALNEDHSSELYSLFEIRDEKNQHIPHTTAYDKQYLEGRYGADPYLRGIIDWEAPYES